MAPSKDELANSFGRAAGAYAASRPGYPASSVDWLVPPDARTVLDLGAGTGKFTELLVAAGHEAIAVEPSEEMLHELRTSLPGVDARLGTAEGIPVDDSSVDAVVAAQAWHWVDGARALDEVARVLRPGGTFAMVWNVRDQSSAWVSALTAQIGESPAEQNFDRVAVVDSRFEPIEAVRIPWQFPLDADSLRTLVTSRSTFITASPDDQRRMLAAVDSLLANHPDLAGRPSFAMPYLTYCYRARLR